MNPNIQWGELVFLSLLSLFFFNLKNCTKIILIAFRIPLKIYFFFFLIFHSYTLQCATEWNGIYTYAYPRGHAPCTCLCKYVYQSKFFSALCNTIPPPYGFALHLHIHPLNGKTAHGTYASGFDAIFVSGIISFFFCSLLHFKESLRVCVCAAVVVVVEFSSVIVYVYFFFLWMIVYK